MKNVLKTGADNGKFDWRA